MIAKYVSALSIAAAAIALRFLVDGELGSSAFVILLLGVLGAACIGGVGPGLLAQTIILVVHARYFAKPGAHAWPPPLRACVNLAAYYAVGLSVAVLSDFFRAARARDRKSAADARAQRERLHAVLACMADGVIAADSCGRIALMNPMAERLLGVSAAEATGAMLADVFRVCALVSREPLPDPFHQATSERGVVHSHRPLLLCTRTDRAIPITFSAAPILESAARLTGVVVVFRDESERHRTEETLREADRRKDEFLATLAHELRNPLAPICMGLELLRPSPSDAPEQSATHAMVERQTRHLVRLIDDLLDVSRISRGKIALRKTLVNLQAAVQDVSEACRATMAQAGHEFFVDLPPQAVVIDVDPDRFMQVLSNLLNNAAKYTPPGGRISIEAKVRGHELHLTVADNGRGIEASRLPTIFEMFNQPNEARERGHSGLGIGLTLCKRLVEMHGGLIEARSDGPGRGSAFSIRLPVARSLPCAGREANEQTPSQAGALCKVLLADDNHDSLVTMRALVAALGHQVSIASDGLEAVEAAEKFAPDVILMDLGMPRMNGYDAAREIRARMPTRNVRLIAVTGWGQAEDRQRTEAAGFDGHLVKPIDLAALSRVLAASGQPESPQAPPVFVSPWPQAPALAEDAQASPARWGGGPLQP